MTLAQKLQWKRLLVVEERAHRIKTDLTSRLYQNCDFGLNEILYPVTQDYAQAEVVSNVITHFAGEGVDVSFDRDKGQYVIRLP